MYGTCEAPIVFGTDEMRDETDQHMWTPHNDFYLNNEVKGVAISTLTNGYNQLCLFNLYNGHITIRPLAYN